MAVSLNDEQTDKLADLMLELQDLQIEINAIGANKTTLTIHERAGIKDKIREWLKIAQKIANELGPSEFNVEAKAGFPPSISIGFTWT
ncbi:MAG: hypothetical protein HQ553_05435 [Chloroflexi bacterium]|nr:hypothetical protein [Chloroflexota bacterium]